MKGIKLIEFVFRKNGLVANWTSSRDELITRCPYCGDSMKDPTHGHLYISEKKPHSWYCQKCGTTAGVLSTDLMKDLNIYDSDFAIYAQQLSYDHKYEKMDLNERKSVIEKRNIGKQPVNLYYDIGKLERKKLKYFKSRMNLKEKDEDLIKNYKIITNFKQFLTYNKKIAKNLSVKKEHLKQQKYLKNLYNFYNDSCIGFLSINNRYIHFRIIDELVEGKKPHWRWKVLPLDTSNVYPKFYTISNKLDLMEPYLNLHLAEGVFDIIGVKNFLNRDDKFKEQNNVFCSATGKSYFKIIQTFLREGFLDTNVYVYSDSDVNKYFFKNLRKFVYKEIELNIFYNKLSSDFGVNSDTIKLKKLIL